ncbi:FecR family protein [Echinicola sp. 20G]|uniref:FecR family protein n=1 Tax=Echinicola sp. 20G TaxID=2781961 RepID=UPI00190FE28C|nr:FecR domain-containing protein [Echinicola sp. 20G]
MMNKQNIPISAEVKIVLHKLLRNIELNPDELQQLNDWYEDQGKSIEFIDMSDNSRETRMLEQINNKLHQNKLYRENLKNDKTLPRTYQLGKSRNNSFSWVKAAVVSMLLIASAILVLGGYFSERGSKADQVKWISYAMPAGKKSKVNLPDGSILYLNSESEVKFQDGFGVHHREIFLEGESYFEVAKDSIPFRVHTQKLVTEAVGTAFNINSYDLSAIKVKLTEGIVKVFVHHAAEPKEIFLERGQEVTLSEGEFSDVSIFNFEQAIAWKNGEIWLEGDSLNDMVQILERWYDVKITIQNPPGTTMKFSGVFKSAMLTHVLESLAYSYKFEYKIDDKDVTIIFQ